VSAPLRPAEPDSRRRRLRVGDGMAEAWVRAPDGRITLRLLWPGTVIVGDLAPAGDEPAESEPKERL
jgi:hypothetical protein